VNPETILALFLSCLKNSFIISALALPFSGGDLTSTIYADFPASYPIILEFELLGLT